MKSLLGIFIILVVVSHETIFAKGGPGRMHNKCCNVPESAGKSEFDEKMKGFRDACRQELGITGKYTFLKLLINRAQKKLLK